MTAIDLVSAGAAIALAAALLMYGYLSWVREHGIPSQGVRHAVGARGGVAILLVLTAAAIVLTAVRLYVMAGLQLL
jgi:hypothetical protein